MAYFLLTSEAVAQMSVVKSDMTVGVLHKPSIIFLMNGR